MCNIAEDLDIGKMDCRLGDSCFYALEFEDDPTHSWQRELHQRKLRNVPDGWI